MSNLRASPGRLVLVVGPSGVGKDSILDAARQALDGRDDILFPRRVITRSASAGGEPHIAVSEAAFLDMVARGAFLLHWQAHGLRYGIPTEADEAIAAGRQVVVNVSRTVLDEARRRFDPLLIVAVQASAGTLRRRLLDRGRESAVQIEERVARAAAFAVRGSNVVVLDNDGALGSAVATFLALLDYVPNGKRAATRNG